MRGRDETSACGSVLKQHWVGRECAMISSGRWRSIIRMAFKFASRSHFFDGTCTATPTSYDASESSCHIRHTSALSCGDALRANTGTTTVQLKWKRVEYDPVVAAKFRVGSPETQRTRDLVHRPVDTFRFKYVYIPKGDCLLAQRSCVRNYGWRRLLMFTSALVNIGPERRLNIARLGDGSLANGTVFVEKGVYTWNQCVGDFRFNRFGRYSVDGRILNRPIATCLHDMKRYVWWRGRLCFTGYLNLSRQIHRYQNNEYSPLATPYDTCEWQGISSGWGFELVAGTPCQWLDLTRQRPWKKRQAKSELNPRGYICEGNPQLTARAKRPLFPSNGAPFAGRPLCNYTKGFMDNNQAEFRLPKPIGQFSAVTRRCGRGRREHGLARDCGWTVAYDAIECNPGAVVRLGVRHSKTELGLLPTLAARICESSRGLNGRSTQCEFADALASATVKPGMESVMTFTCPSARDDVETGGLVSVLVAKFAPWESRGEVKANVVVGWK